MNLCLNCKFYLITLVSLIFIITKIIIIKVIVGALLTDL
jgi:hypothetical protein